MPIDTKGLPMPTSTENFPAILTVTLEDGQSHAYVVAWAANGEIEPGPDGVSFDERMGFVYGQPWTSGIAAVDIHLPDCPGVKSSISGNSDPETGLYVDLAPIADYARQRNQSLGHPTTPSSPKR